MKDDRFNSYKHHRETYPDQEYTELTLIYGGDTEFFEVRYQAEKRILTNDIGYINYRTIRINLPLVSFEALRQIFGDKAVDFEDRYQREIDPERFNQYLAERVVEAQRERL